MRTLQGLYQKLHKGTYIFVVLFQRPYHCFYYYTLQWIYFGLPGWHGGKESPANAGDARDVGLIPGSGRSLGEEKWKPASVFLPGKFRGQRSLAGSWRIHGVTQSHTRLSMHTGPAVYVLMN